MIVNILQPDDSSCPCLNGGTCEYFKGRGQTIIYCHCPIDFIGNRCEISECKQFYPKYACFVNQFQNLASILAIKISKVLMKNCNFPINTLATYIL